jgi:hypothetical protein
MARVDLDRLGGLGWVHRTNGRLSRSERTRLLFAIARALVPTVVGRAKSVTGWVPARAREVDARAFAPPTSRLAREAEDACALLPGGLALHSYRTWMLGLALAAADGCQIMNDELFFCAALLHDFGLVHPTWGVDFTLAGANRAMACVRDAGLADSLAQAVGDAICVHPTVGISIERDGPIGYYVQWGAMADIGGLRLWDITRANQDEVFRRYPRERSFGKSCAALIEAEATAVRNGRFAFYAHLGMPTLVRVAAGRPR